MALKSPGTGTNYLGWAMIGAVLWSIWLTRNDYVFNNKLCSSPANLVFKIISLVSQWTALAPVKREKKWTALLDKLKLATKELHTNVFL